MCSKCFDYFEKSSYLKVFDHHKFCLNSADYSAAVSTFLTLTIIVHIFFSATLTLSINMTIVVIVWRLARTTTTSKIK